jgi:hypothetical protein
MVLTFLLGILGVATGAIITWQVASQYYERASRELKSETQILRGLTYAILQAMQDVGLAKIQKDEQGTMTDIVIDLKGRR